MTNFKSYKVQEIDWKSEEFPDILRQFKKPVKRLRFRGEWKKDIFDKALAVVGSRRNTRYGLDIIDRFLPALVAKKYSIVSGFYYGIDTFSHKKTLESGGKTIAVLPSGLNVCTPTNNENLYVEIIENGGLVVSEYDDNFSATLWSFPQRNRIVAGLSNKGVLVIEAGLKSGSLITARIANEMGRDVYAVPGSIFSKTSMGCNSLIQDLKANLVAGPEDILGLPKDNSSDQMQLFEDLRPEDKEIVDILIREPSTIDEIAKELGKNSFEVSGILSLLSLKGVVEEVGGKFQIL